MVMKSPSNSPFGRKPILTLPLSSTPAGDQAPAARQKQMARNLTDEVDGFLLKHKHLIMDRDPVFTRDFRRMLKDRGVKSVRLPSRSPNLNAFAERFIRSVRQECLSKVIPLGGNHLRDVLDQYMAHYHVERNHQGLRNVLLTPANDNHLVTTPVIRRKRLGGLLSYYHRRAA